MITAVMPNYGSPEIAFERGEGIYIFDTDGKRYLDFGTGIAVTALGHAHPYLVAALTEQAGKLWHCSNLYRIPGQERLAQRLVDATFADSVFFCNSGAEAVECGLKMIRRYQDVNGKSERYRVITCESGFHGRTLATISAGGNPKHREGFGPPVDGFDHVAFGNLNEVRNAITEETAAILVEPIQGEGGINLADSQYFEGLRQTADEFDLILFFDEVQTGIGRTGKLFAHEWTDVTPDLMAVAKGLGGGFPVGACLSVEKCAETMTAGTHGSTFGGNPLGVATANAVLDIIMPDEFLNHVQKMSAHLSDELNRVARIHPDTLGEVRGAGLLLGVKCVVTNMDLVNELIDRGMLTIPAGDNVVRFIPPLIVEKQDITEAMSILDDACGALSAP